MSNITPGTRAFVGDADGYPDWADAEVEVLDITPDPLGDPDLALAHVLNVQTGAETELFTYRLEPIIDLDAIAEDESDTVPDEPAEDEAPTYPTFEVGQRVRVADPAGTRAPEQAEESDEGIGFVMPVIFGQEGVIEDLGYTENVYRVSAFGLSQYVHAAYLTPVGEQEDEQDDLFDFLDDLLGTDDEDEDTEDVPEETSESEGVDFGAAPSDVDMATNDIERRATPALIRAVLRTIKPGDRVRVVGGEVRVFTPEGKADAVYLKPGAYVTVVSVGDGAGGTYAPERTVSVRCGSITQWVDVTSLHPVSDAQRKAVEAAYEAEHDGDAESVTRELAEAEQRAQKRMIDALLDSLGLDPEELDAQPIAEGDLDDEGEDDEDEDEDTDDDPLTAVKEGVEGLEALASALPESGVARRAAALAMAQEVVSQFPSAHDADIMDVLAVAAFLIGDDDA